MSIPTEKQFYLPILKMMADDKERHTSEILDCLDKEFQFSEADKSERLASGSSRLKNRIAWGTITLTRAGLLEKTKRAYFKITGQGQEVLQEILKANLTIIDRKFLLRYAPTDSPFFYPEKKGEEKVSSEEEQDEDVESTQTPLELIDKNYQLLKNNLAIELLEAIKNKDPGFFEELVVKLLTSMGYGGSHEEAGQAIGGSHDGGIDGIIKEDKLGLDTIYLQAKRYDDNSVGEGAIRNFVGALAAKHAQKGIFITTASYTKSAREFVSKIPQKVILIDGNDLVDLMIENNVGVSEDTTFEIKKINPDYFE